MCCGQKRSAMRTTANSSAQNTPTTATAANASAPRTALRYTENSAIKVKGPATGRVYEFSSARPMQNVDPSDARLLVRSRFFRQG